MTYMNLPCLDQWKSIPRSLETSPRKKQPGMTGFKGMPGADDTWLSQHVENPNASITRRPCRTLQTNWGYLVFAVGACSWPGSVGRDGLATCRNHPVYLPCVSYRNDPSIGIWKHVAINMFFLGRVHHILVPLEGKVTVRCGTFATGNQSFSTSMSILLHVTSFTPGYLFRVEPCRLATSNDFNK